jgi:hypothetical protein
MARGRRPSGRSPALNPDRVTRTAGRILAVSGSGAGHWRERHERKSPLTFCDALKEERAQFRTVLPGDLHRAERRDIYPCRYGQHYLIESAPLHWHIGRTGRRTTQRI